MTKLHNLIIKQKGLYVFAFLPMMLGVSGVLPGSLSVIEDGITTTETLSQSDINAEKIEKIRKYMSDRDMPLADNAEDFVLAANRYGLDYRLLPAIAVMESSGGKKMTGCTYNPFGWGSCRKGFSYKNYKESIYDVASHMGGARDSTSKWYSASKDIKDKLKLYNSVNPTYYNNVILTMNNIDNQKVS